MRGSTFTTRQRVLASKLCPDQSSNWFVKHPHQRRDLERQLRMTFQRGAANANFNNRTSTRWVVVIQHDPDRAQSSDPTSNPPTQHFHCGLASCGIKLISTTTGRPLPEVSICTSCCGVVWCAGCLIVAFIERLPHPIKCTQCGRHQRRRLESSLSVLSHDWTRAD